MDESSQRRVAAISDDLRKALDALYDKGANVIGEGVKDSPTFSEPQHIYHYTTHAGFWDILKSGKLWLTDIFSLNDPSELEHGLNLANDMLDKKAKETPAKYSEIAKNFSKLCLEEDDDLPHFFVCSFSKNGDDLGQWRGYAEDGRGYALGFGPNPLKKRFNDGQSTTPDGVGFLVEYDDAKLIDIYSKLIDCVLAEKSEISRNYPLECAQTGYSSSLRSVYFRLVLHASVYFKHKAYCNEREYRFLNIQKKTDPNPILKRTRNYELIKYIEFDWKSSGTDILKKIVIGPAADLEKSRKFAEDCLREAGIDIDDDAITQSPIPYKPA